MERIVEILEEIQPGVDYETCENLIDGGVLDSLSIINIVAELEDTFDIVIPTVEIIPENFNSAKLLWEMVLRLQEDG